MCPRFIRRLSRRRDQCSSDALSTTVTLKPVYVYPGLLRHFRDHAVNLDGKCPAEIYECLECKTGASKQFCLHHSSCSICLDAFHDKDLVRKMPCSSKHVFHTRCIITWFSGGSGYCPLCKEVVDDSQVPVRRLRRLASVTNRSRIAVSRSSSPVETVDSATSHVPEASSVPTRASGSIDRSSFCAISACDMSSSSAGNGESAAQRQLFQSRSFHSLKFRSLLPPSSNSVRSYSFIARDKIRSTVDY